MGADILFQLLSVGLTLIGAMVSVVAAVQTRSDTRRQHELELFSIEQEYYRDLRQWADRAIEMLTEAIFICRIETAKAKGETYATRLEICRRDLSASIDQGRLFFPNEQIDEHGVEKPGAYQGYRSPVLNSLMYTYRILGGDSAGAIKAAAETEIWKHRQTFVSDIQQLLDPKERTQHMERLRVAEAERRAGR